jgi:hypothetical protein
VECLQGLYFYFFNRGLILIRIRVWNEKFNTVNYLRIEYKELSIINRVGMEISSEDITSNSRDKILTSKTPQVWGKIVRLIKD